MFILCVCVETMRNHINILVMGGVGTKFREKGLSYLSGYLFYSAECNWWQYYFLYVLRNTHTQTYLSKYARLWASSSSSKSFWLDLFLPLTASLWLIKPKLCRRKREILFPCTLLLGCVEYPFMAINHFLLQQGQKQIALTAVRRLTCWEKIN